MTDAAEFLTTYESYLVRYGRRPPNYRRWKADVGATDVTGLETYLAAEQSLFQSWLRCAIDLLDGESLYAQYQIRDKVLALFFAWAEQWQAHAEVLRIMVGYAPMLPFATDYASGAEALFKDQVRALLQEGLGQGEVADRWKLNEGYPALFWAQARLLLLSFLHDTSQGYQRTDAAIEKSVRFVMDLVQPNALDSGVDMIRFFVKK